MNTKKKDLGQFYTTNYAYILQNMKQPTHNYIIEPFAGNKDLLSFLSKESIVEMYDIDPKFPDIIQRDTLLYPPDFAGKYLITNPPFIARNKQASKLIYDMYRENDLYKCFLRLLINNPPIGGIIILPVNFWSSIREKDANLRRDFLTKFTPTTINIFEEQVFEDTKYNITSIQFIQNCFNTVYKFNVYPSTSQYTFILDETNNYTIGGEIYNLYMHPQIDIYRITRKNINPEHITKIFLYALDSNSRNQIRLENCSERSFATLSIYPVLNLYQQQKIVELFNMFVAENRKKYNSLFLPNYRENSNIARKRMPFSLAYRIINFLIWKNAIYN
jgi:hypothetical protein